MDTLLKLRNNFVTAFNKDGIAKADEVSKDNMSFLSCLEMRMVGLVITFGFRKRVQLKTLPNVVSYSKNALRG